MNRASLCCIRIFFRWLSRLWCVSCTQSRVRIPCQATRINRDFFFIKRLRDDFLELVQSEDVFSKLCQPIFLLRISLVFACLDPRPVEAVSELTLLFLVVPTPLLPLLLSRRRSSPVSFHGY